MGLIKRRPLEQNAIRLQRSYFWEGSGRCPALRRPPQTRRVGLQCTYHQSGPQRFSWASGQQSGALQCPKKLTAKDECQITYPSDPYYVMEVI
jgi:hypothetical protein